MEAQPIEKPRAKRAVFATATAVQVGRGLSITRDARGRCSFSFPALGVISVLVRWPILLWALRAGRK